MADPRMLEKKRKKAARDALAASEAAIERLDAIGPKLDEALRLLRLVAGDAGTQPEPEPAAAVAARKAPRRKGGLLGGLGRHEDAPPEDAPDDDTPDDSTD